MADPYSKISPATAAWLQSIEEDGSVERALLTVLAEAESSPDLFKALGLARDFFYSPDLRLLGRAAVLLGRFDNPAAQALLEVLLNHADPRLRVVALEAAHLSGSSWALRKCVARLADRDERVLARAFDLYRSWPREDVRAMFAQLLDMGDTTSLIDAAEGLARVADRDLLDLVERTYVRVDVSLKRKLTRGLVRIASPEVNQWIKGMVGRITDQLARDVLEAALKEMNAAIGVVEQPAPPPPAAEARRVPAFHQAAPAAPAGVPGFSAPPQQAVMPQVVPQPVAPPPPVAAPVVAPPQVAAPVVAPQPVAAPVVAPQPVAPPPVAAPVVAAQPVAPPPVAAPVVAVQPVTSPPVAAVPVQAPVEPVAPESPSPSVGPLGPSSVPLANVRPAENAGKPAIPVAPPAAKADAPRFQPLPAELMSNPELDLSELRSSLSESGTFTIGDDLLGPDDDTLDPDSTVGDDSALGVGAEEFDVNAPKKLSFTPIDRSDVFKRPSSSAASRPGPAAAGAPSPVAAGAAAPGSGISISAPTAPPAFGAPGGPTQVVVSQVSVPGVTMETGGRARRASRKLPQIRFTAADTERLHALLKQLASKGGSDLHLKPGLPAFARINGKVQKLGTTALSGDQLLSAMASILTPAQLETYLLDGDLDLSIGLAGAGRFRINMLRSRGLPGLVARLIPSDVPSMEDLHLPPLICQLTDDAAGMILVTGPTGSGKSTTLAAVLDYINSSRHGHIITVEDPVEFLHRDKLCTITQREVGTDAATFAEGLQFANRMDPDVVMVGELRDIDTIRAAFHAAGAGRLVLATVHTNSAAKTVERIISAFPADDQPQARVTLSLSLTAVVSQSLVPASVGGRVPAHEIMIATGAIRKAIRENNTTAMYNQIESGGAYGMVTLEQSLVKLYKAGKITRRDALRWASDAQLVENLLD